MEEEANYTEGEMHTLRYMDPPLQSCIEHRRICISRGEGGIPHCKDCLIDEGYPKDVANALEFGYFYGRGGFEG